MKLTHAASQGALESGVFCAIRLSRGAAEVTKAIAERIKTEVILTISNVQGYLTLCTILERWTGKKTTEHLARKKWRTKKEMERERKRLKNKPNPLERTPYILTWPPGVSYSSCRADVRPYDRHQGQYMMLFPSEGETESMNSIQFNFPSEISRCRSHQNDNRIRASVRNWDLVDYYTWDLEHLSMRRQLITKKQQRSRFTFAGPAFLFVQWLWLQ